MWGISVKTPLIDYGSLSTEGSESEFYILQLVKDEKNIYLQIKNDITSPEES